MNVSYIVYLQFWKPLFDHYVHFFVSIYVLCLNKWICIILFVFLILFAGFAFKPFFWLAVSFTCPWRLLVLAIFFFSVVKFFFSSKCTWYQTRRMICIFFFLLHQRVWIVSRFQIIIYNIKPNNSNHYRYCNNNNSNNPSL